MDSQAVRTWLQETMAGKMELAQLCPRLASNAREFFMPSRTTDGDGSLPFFVLRQGDKTTAVVFTDAELASAFNPGVPFARGTAAWQVLQAVIRRNLEGLVLNPATERFLLDGKMMRLLFREYALHVLGEQGGAWVPTRDGQSWILELQPGVLAVPVYLTQEDARAMGEQVGALPELVPWTAVRAQCQAVGAEAPYLQFGYAEQVGLLRPHIAFLCNDGAVDPLDKLEQEIGKSAGIANATAICDALAALSHIWTIADSDGDLVALGPALDFFTSASRAQAFIAEAHRANPKLGAMNPRYLPAAPLFKMLAQQVPAIMINRGSAESWFGMNDTIPNVLRRLQ
jgi:hypothetical protein